MLLLPAFQNLGIQIFSQNGRKLLSPDLNHRLGAMVSDKLRECGQPGFSLFLSRIGGTVKGEEFVIDTGHNDPVRKIFSTTEL
jgi:hypothetical protein